MPRSLKLILVSLFLTTGLWASKPNILFILIDDMGYHDLGCYGSDFYQTPHIDQLAAQSLQFERAYAAAAICSPTRASIVTGKYPARLHLTDWITGWQMKKRRLKDPEWQKSLPHDEDTIGELLAKEGYQTAWVGKWHLGTPPQEHGFSIVAGEDKKRLNNKLNEDDPKGVRELTDEAIKIFKARSDKPIFLALSHYSVHTPIHFNPEVRDRYEAKINPNARQQNPEFAAMVEPLDESIGQLVEYLKGSGLWKNTVIVFYSDNGGLLGKTNNAPLRAGKGSLYEGGVRVPLLVRMPDGSRAGEHTKAVTISNDFLPTFMELATGKTYSGKSDGLSLLPHLRDANAPVGHQAIYWHYPHYHRKGDPAGAILEDDYKLIEFFDSQTKELYNLAEDPSESKDLFAEQPERAAKLHADLVRWRTEVGAQEMPLNPKYKASKKKQ